MPTTRPRVPGWHPDPEDPSFLRHWNGRKWGRERRPRPAWAPLTPGVVPAAPLVGGPAPGGDGPAAPRVRRWGLVAGAALVLGVSIIALSVWLNDGPDIPPRTVADVRFTDQAEAVCAAKLPPLREGRPEVREDTGTEEEFAARVDRAADGLAGVIRDLRVIPVAPADAAEIEAWLEDWDAYVAVGRTYAERIRAGDENAPREIEGEGTRLSTAIFVFARANGMPACAL